MRERVLLPNGLVVVVGQACNLKCENCGNFSPYAPKHNQYYAVENIINSLKILFQIIEPFDCIQIQGGEPFLYFDLCKIISFCRQSQMMNHILIATNGLIEPSEEVLQCLKDKHVIVRISDYNINDKKVKKLRSLCDAKGIVNHTYAFASGNHDWYYLGG